MPKSYVFSTVGNIELITFRTTRQDHPYITSLSALLSGYSSGHIALRLNFSDTNLYNEYVRDNPKIPQQKTINPKTGAEEYQVYFSFWPENESACHERSCLKSYKFDCEKSANYSPFTYNQKYFDYLQPPVKIASPQITLLRELMSSFITLPPSIILHTSRIGLAYGDKQKMIENKHVMEAAERYAKAYSLWRSSLIRLQNAEFIYQQQPEKLVKFKKLCLLALLILHKQQKHLKKIMFPTENISDTAFIHHLSQYITFGYTERDSISLPLVHNNQAPGLELEPILATIKHIADNPAMHPYNVLGTNCAYTADEILLQGIKNSPNPDIQAIITSLKYLHTLGITITPNIIMYQYAKLQIIIEAMKEQSIHEQNLAKKNDKAATQLYCYRSSSEVTSTIEPLSPYPYPSLQ